MRPTKKLIWASADIAKNRSGVIWWEGEVVTRVIALADMGSANRRKKLVENGETVEVFETERAAWEAAMPPGCRAFVFEDGYVAMRKGIQNALVLAEARARVLAYVGANEPGEVPYQKSSITGVRVHHSSWTTVVGKSFGVPSWPAKRDPGKALAIKLVQSNWKISPPEDECEAILIGWWWVLEGQLLTASV